ncbi:IscS subfamily cysteine desulfurase [Bacillus pinisoli]|uniref:IscS subfamily cysteine desulfurase n=1 Tax=Bacillus pinisoli TaxID=2901866 RepID=UPI001FF66347|nr:IscS subfamily cysteine desulfurase [Bacillus pinisoli]
MLIYLDYAATTPMREEAIQALTEANKHFYGNPSSLHDIGTKASNLLETCRGELAKLISGEGQGVFFTSGGSESNILAIRSLLHGNVKKGNHLITTKIEHSSVFNLFQQLEKEGFEVTYLSVDSTGQINIDELKQAIQPTTILASIHHANSEIGTIQPIEEIGRLLHEHNVLFHSDCVQTFGKLPINVKTSYIDSLSISSHKLYGPKGVGACYINPQLQWTPYFEGTSHEKGFRPGTVNVPGIASFLSAAQLIHEDLEKETDRLLQLRNHFLNGIIERQLPIQIEGNSTHTLPHILGLSIQGMEGQYAMLECNRHGLAISTGSACSVGKQAPSKTMIAIGKDASSAKQFVRISFGKWTTTLEIDQTLQTLENIISTYQKK